MGRRGPKPKPTKLKVLAGERSDRINHREPDPPRGRPEKPEDLTGLAGEEWDRIIPVLEAMGILTIADGPAVAMYCVAYERWRRARDAYADKLHFSTTGGGSRPDACVGIAERAEQRMLNLLSRFGMTPADRSRVQVDPDQEDPFGAFLAAREELG